MSNKFVTPCVAPMAYQPDGRSNAVITEDEPTVVMRDAYFREPEQPRLVGLAGAAGSGKSTVTKFLVEEYGYEVIKFASVLKDMLRAMGLTEDHIEGHLKEVPCDLLEGKSPRHAMITLGTEWGRDLIGPDLWINLWRRRVQRALDFGNKVIVDDLRFANECKAIEDLGGTTIRIFRPEGTVVVNHVSEKGEFITDYEVINDATKEQLYKYVKSCISVI
jgi:hypothetical protein